jgi:hypothetical protein
LKDTSEDDLTSSIDQQNNQIVNKNIEIINTIKKPIIDHETPAVKKSSVTKLHPPPNQSSTVITATPMPPINISPTTHGSQLLSELSSTYIV